MEPTIYSMLDPAYRVERAIPLEAFLHSGNLTEKGKACFKLYAVSVTLQFILRVDHHDFSRIVPNGKAEELHILELRVKTRSDGWWPLLRLAMIVANSYPRPVLLIMRYKDTYAYFVAKTHVNSRNENKNAVENIRGSGWFDSTNLERLDANQDVDPSLLDFYSPDRVLEKQIADTISNTSSITEIINQWFKQIEADRMAWSYYYHQSDAYVAGMRDRKGADDLMEEELDEDFRAITFKEHRSFVARERAYQAQKSKERREQKKLEKKDQNGMV